MQPSFFFNFSDVTGSDTFVGIHSVLKMHFLLTGALNNLMRSFPLSVLLFPVLFWDPEDATQGQA